MKVALIHNTDHSGVINVLAVQNREIYDPATIEAVASALENGGHNVRIIDGNMHVIEQLREFMPRVVAGERPGMVFNMAYGIQGVSRYTHLPAMLEMLGVPYIGSNPQAHSLALDKIVAKLLFQNHGIPTPKFWNFASPDDVYDDLTYPLIVKPKMEAASLGLRVVREEKDLRQAVDDIVRRYAQHALVEEFIPGREFTIGLLGSGDIEVLPIVELSLEGNPNRIRDDEEKNPLEKICPADLPAEKTDELRELARRSFRALGLHDYGRIDLRMDRAGNPFVLEINSMADLGPGGAYAFAARAAGYEFDALINRLLDVAAVRCFGADARDVGSETTRAAGRQAAPSTLSGQLRGYLRSHASSFEDELEQLVMGERDRWAHVVARLRRLGFSQSAPRPADDVAGYFTNHRESENDVLLVAFRPPSRERKRALEYRVEGNRLYGTGIARTHAQVETLFAALEALRHARLARPARCGVLLCSERHGPTLQSIVETVARRSRRVIGVSESDAQGKVVTSRPGRFDYRLEMEASGAEGAAHLCERVAAILRHGGRPGEATVELRRLGISLDATGSFEEALAELSLTFVSGEAAASCDAQIRRLLGAGDEEADAIELACMETFPALSDGPENRAFFAELEALAKEWNAPVHAVADTVPSPLCFVPAGIPTLDGLGPAVGGVDGVDEHVLRHSLVDRALLLALLIHGSTGSEGT